LAQHAGGDLAAVHVNGVVDARHKAPAPGDGVELLVPRPSWPLPLAPTQATVLSSKTAQEWRLPAEMAVATLLPTLARVTWAAKLVTVEVPRPSSENGGRKGGRETGRGFGAEQVGAGRLTLQGRCIMHQAPLESLNEPRVEVAR
jgi:hypothetical protein